METLQTDISDLKGGKPGNNICAAAPADVKINKEFYRKVLEEYSDRNSKLPSVFICHRSVTFQTAWLSTNTWELILNDRERFLEEFSDTYRFLEEKKEWDDEVQLFSFNAFVDQWRRIQTREDFLKWAAENAAD